MATKKRAGDAPTEEVRRARVVKGWAFMDLSNEKIEAIKKYLDGGPVPLGYEHLDKVIR